jgi:hypothetical protein
MHYLKSTAAGIAIVAGGVFIAFANGQHAPSSRATMRANTPTTAAATDPQMQVLMLQVLTRMDALEAENSQLRADVQFMKRELEAERDLLSQSHAEAAPAVDIPPAGVRHQFNGSEYCTSPITSK